MSWNILGNLSGKLIGPVLQILIARLLKPEDYGIFAVVMAIMGLYDVVKELGLTQAIIVNQGEDNDISLQFTVQLFVGMTLYVLLLISTPFIADFYQNDEYYILLPLTGSLLFINVLADPLITYFLKIQNYRLLALRQMILPFVTGIVGLSFAYWGYGVYALIVSKLTGQITIVALLQWKSPVKLRFYWNSSQFRDLQLLGRQMIIQRFSGFLVNEADSLIIGKKLGSPLLGNYRVSQRFVNIFPSTIFTQIQQVLFTDLAQHKGDTQYLNRRYYQFVYGTGIFFITYTILVCLLSPILVPLVLGENWGEMVPILQILSTGLVTGWITGLNNDISRILGFAAAYSYYSVIRSMVTLGGVFWAAHYSLRNVVITWVIISMFANVVNDLLFYTCQKVIKFRIKKYLLIVAAWLWMAFIINQV